MNQCSDCFQNSKQTNRTDIVYLQCNVSKEDIVIRVNDILLTLMCISLFSN